MTPRPPSPGGRPRRGRHLRRLAAMLLALPLLMGASAVPDDGGDRVPVTVQSIAGATAPTSITLVTGDRVVLEPAAAGRAVATVEPAPRSDGRVPEFEMVEDGEDFYVVPSDAVPLIPERLDRELFNVGKLVEYGYTDGTRVIMTGAPARAAAGKPAGVSVTVALPSVDGYAATVAADDDWWRTFAPAGAPGAKAAGAGKVWLDEMAQVTLAESVPMIGAPQAWESGFDGTGVTVAVLDTGIDATHPDLAGKVVEAKNFTSEADTRDGHGHGTHVAGTVVGSGAGSDGKYTGVAPGAKLLIGKICNSAGSCPNSATIAAMQWAAPRADVISMSIGSSVGDDGTSVTAQAVNNLTRQYDALFVVAAGNNGAQGAGSIASPGSADAALTVGAVDKKGQLASFSGRGPRLGDFGIKPDVTAPGVAIVAPRAAGTSMGTPVNDRYTSANGTSMATPHVAGAAAIVRQKHPDLSAAAVKAALTTTAKPNPALTVYTQGGGLVNVPAALDAPVLASPTPLNLGFFRYPHDDTAPVEKTVTYTNRSDAPVTVDLALAVTASDGTAVPGSVLSVEPGTVTVPAGGTATATVRLNAAGLATGGYGGYLVADSGSGGQVRTPVGFYLEPEMYDVVIEGIARDGRAADQGSVHIRHAVDTWIFAMNSVPFRDGAVRLRVPPGPYFITGTISTLDGENALAQDRTFVGVPTLQVTKDTTVRLDARQAREMTFETPAHRSAAPFGISRIITHFEAEKVGDITATWLMPWSRTYVLEAGGVSVGGGFEFVANARLGDAPLTVEVVAPQAFPLHPRPLSGTPPLDGDDRLPLVFAGQGAEADYDGIDVRGAAVLTERDGPTLAAKEATARAHGAKALLVMNRTTGFFSDKVGADARVPAMAIAGEEGQRLRDLLADGTVTVRVAGTSFSPYLYDVYQVEPNRLPGQPHYVVRPEQMARVDNAFHGQPRQIGGEYRAAWRPYQDVGAAQYSEVPGARRRTEYVTAGDTLYRQQVAPSFPSGGAVQERDTYYQGGEHRKQRWLSSPMRPSAFEPNGPKNPGDPARRTGDTIRLILPEWWDNNTPGHYGSLNTSTDSSAFRLYSDGVLIGDAPRPRVTINNLAAESHTYRFEVDTARQAAWWPTSTSTTTAWTVRSARPAAGTTEVLPLLLVDYDTELDLTNTAPHPSDRNGPATVDLRVRHQVGAAAPAVVGARAWVSYDDGGTWEQRPVHARGDGRYRAILDSPDPAETNGFVTLRVEAWDAAGNRVEQRITRAWRLAQR